MSDERDTLDGDGNEDRSSVRTGERTDGSTNGRPSGKRPGRGPRGATAPATKAAAVRGSTRPAKKTEKDRRDNIFKRIIQFLREVVAELRKVIWPNRKQMVTYTSVVLVFVVFMVAYISGLDVLFIKGVGWLFG